MCILGAVYVASAPAKDEILPITSRISAAQLRDLQRRVAGCNANVCFAIDGSGSISPANFEAQKEFVQDVATIIADGTNPVELAAVQYGTSSSAIIQLTLNTNAFQLAIKRTPQIGGLTFVNAGINFCFSQLWRRRGEANKIVLLGDGRTTIGSNAVRRADLFRRVGGDVCTVGAGFQDPRELLAIAGGDPARVFQVDDFISALELQYIIEDIVLDICGVPGSSVAPVAHNLNNGKASKQNHGTGKWMA